MMEFWIEREVYGTFKSGDVGADVSSGLKGEISVLKIEKNSKS